jgi:hypothetical protein
VQPVDARATFEPVASADKTFVGVGSAFGHAAPYGHEDLLVGRNTLVELWAQVAEWLATRVNQERTLETCRKVARTRLPRSRAALDHMAACS